MSSEAGIDPLSDVLSLLKPRSYSSGGFGVGGDLSVQFPPHEGVKCYALISGQCWLAVDGVPAPVLLTAGDCFLLPTGHPFRLATDLALPSIDSQTLIAELRSGRIPGSSSRSECFIAGGHFALAGDAARILLDMLPPIVHIRSEPDKAELRWSLERLREELIEQRPGASLVAQQLAYMLLIQALRLHLEEQLTGRVGWLFALKDKQMTAAIQAIHNNPAHRWRLQELAERAGMSRSVFALRFKLTVGSTPMDYVARWRILLAADKLTNSSDSVSEIAASLGYQSESAFGKTFRRFMGCSPRQFQLRDQVTTSTNEPAATRRLAASTE